MIYTHADPITMITVSPFLVKHPFLNIWSSANGIEFKPDITEMCSVLSL